MAWPFNTQPRDKNHNPLLAGLASDESGVPVPVAVNPATGALKVDATVEAEVTLSGNSNANAFTGQKTVSTSAVQISSSSNALANGMLIKALSTNAGNIMVGLTGVTAANGDVLEPGEVRGYAVNNTNLLYIISAASTTDGISYSAN